MKYFEEQTIYDSIPVQNMILKTQFGIIMTWLALDQIPPTNTCHSNSPGLTAVLGLPSIESPFTSRDLQTSEKVVVTKTLPSQ